MLLEILPHARIRGASPIYLDVATELVGGSVRFSFGWSLFVESEKIVSGDFGLFILSSPHTFEMRLFDRAGKEKPMSARPMIWNLFFAHGEEGGNENPSASDSGINNHAGKII